MGVVKNQKNKTKNDVANKNKKQVVNGKTQNGNEKVKKKKKVSCLQCLKSSDDGGVEGKYRVAAPELMQDTFMSDSEDEGGEVECPIQQQQQYRYMNSEAGTLHRARPLEDSVTDGHLWPSNNDHKVATIERQPVDIGFLVSFVVDARGGAMKAKRRGGVRVIVPPAACAAPTRVTCRAASRRAPVAPPPLMEGEALAARLLELQPQGAKFLAPVMIEVPIFTASCPEREIVILRSDTGETWQDHYLHNNDNIMIQEALQRERQEHGPTGESVGEGGERVSRIITCDFPHYLAVVSRIRQEVHIVGPDGGAVNSKHIPQIQALFPAAALTKRIRVGVQAHVAPPALAGRVLPRRAAVSPVITVEPRRRKFHRSITLTAPLPDMEKPHDKQSSQSLRLLCSIMGGQARAVWEDVTGSTPITITDNCASFTTTVSARFWLMNCQNVSDATKLATELYREMLLVPFEVRIVVLGKRLDAVEGRLLVMYITDRYAYETLLQQEHYVEVAHSTSVRFLDGKEVYLEFSGNLVPVTKSGSQPMFPFEAFKDNRIEFPVRVKHQEEPASGRIYFMNEPKVAKGEQSQTPACVLDVQLPEQISPRAGKSQMDYLNLDQSGFDALNDELSFHWGDHTSVLPPSIPTQVNGHDKIITNGDVIKHPAKETDSHDTKPQVNGDTHVDTNKTKATFDSDEDKTPNNTLEKGKSKDDKPGFLGGLADRVKNVFSHSEDKDDSKESSPKPQPKPRETKEKEKSPSKPKETKEKEKSPPKPAPRIINEDLLDKVEDMFKDLKSKPHSKEDEIYSTKLVVDEDIPFDMRNVTVEISDQYANKQPIDTPLVCKSTDPFQFYVGCCEGKYAKGQRHRHDETSTVVDRIEQVKFSAQEKLQDISDRADNTVKDGIDKLEQEKDTIKQQANEEVEKIQADLRNKEKHLKTEVNEAEKKAHDKFDELKDLSNQVKEHISDKTKDAQSNVESGIEKTKESAKNIVDHLTHDINDAKDEACHKVQVLNFLAKEQEEELRLRSQDTKKVVKDAVDDVKHRAESVERDLKQKVQDGTKTVADSMHSAQDSLVNKAHEMNQDIKNVAGHTQEKAADKLNEINKAVDNAKDKTDHAVAQLKSQANDAGHEIQKEAKKKSKSGKKFISGLVDNIFGEKKKVEDEVKNKFAEGKDTVNEGLDKAAAKKDEIKQNVDNKQEELKRGAENLAQNINDKKKDFESSVHDTKEQITKSVVNKSEELQKAAHDKANELESAIQNKTEEAKKSVQDKTSELETTIQNKKDEIANSIEDKKVQVQVVAQNELDRITQAAEKTTEQIKKSAEDAVNAASDKKNEVQSNINNKLDEIQQSSKDEVEKLQSAASGKVNELQKSSKQAFDNAQDSALSAFDTVETSAKDKVNDAKETWEDLHSSTRDTFADFKDDVHGLESSAQDTLHSFQSSAGNTFDSLEDSAREYIGGAQTVALNVENHSKQLFGDANDAFEGFQISADNKLQDVRGAAMDTTDNIVSEYENIKDLTKERLEAAGDRLKDVGDEVNEAAKRTEKNIADVVSSEADQFTSNLNDLGNSVFGSSGKGFMKDSSTKLLESEKAQSSPSPQKKGSGIPKLKQKRRK